MKKIVLVLLLSITLLSITLFADTKITIVPYISSATYDSNLTDKDILSGIYTHIKNDAQTLEFSIESKKLTYTNTSNIDKLNQLDFTIAYATPIDNEINIYTLLHYISNDAKSNKAKIFLLDITKKYNNNMNLNLELAYSFYNQNTLAQRIIQVKPSLKLKYGHINSKWGVLHPKISFYYIEPSGENITLQKSYFSSEFALTHIKGSFVTSMNIWFGEQINAVRDRGFSVYNLDELHTHGYLISSRYKYSNDLGLKLSYTGETYKTYTSAVLGTSDEIQKRILLIADFTF